jgi:hypothetical protein
MSISLALSLETESRLRLGQVVRRFGHLARAIVQLSRLSSTAFTGSPASARFWPTSGWRG